MKAKRSVMMMMVMTMITMMMIVITMVTVMVMMKVKVIQKKMKMIVMMVVKTLVLLKVILGMYCMSLNLAEPAELGRGNPSSMDINDRQCLMILSKFQNINRFYMYK